MYNNFDFDFNKEKKKEKNSKKFSNIIGLNNNENDYNRNDNNKKENFFSIIFESLKAWFNSITFTVRIIVVLSVMFWMLDLITIGYITFCFSNVPYYTIGYLQIWRLVTGNLITTGFFSLLIAIIFWVSDARRGAVFACLAAVTDAWLPCKGSCRRVLRRGMRGLPPLQGELSPRFTAGTEGSATPARGAVAAVYGGD